MNQREALAVQMLLDWVLALHTFEISDPADHLDDIELIRTIGVLADRAHATFGAGLTQGDAIAAAMRMLGTEPAAIRYPDWPRSYELHPCPTVLALGITS